VSDDLAISIPPPKEGVSKSVYLNAELVARLEHIMRVSGYKKLSPVIEILLEQAASQWEKQNPKAGDK